jgi:hypothetical protein
MNVRLLVVCALLAGCGSSSSDGDAPRPCTLVTKAEMEAILKGPLAAPMEERDTCRFLSADSVDAEASAIGSITLHTLANATEARAFYASVVAQTQGMATTGAGERTYCSEITSFAGAKMITGYALVGRHVLQPSIVAPAVSCEMSVAIAAAAAGRL